VRAVIIAALTLNGVAHLVFGLLRPADNIVYFSISAASIALAVVALVVALRDEVTP
jgi:hypothetical protein